MYKKKCGRSSETPAAKGLFNYSVYNKGRGGGKVGGRCMDEGRGMDGGRGRFMGRGWAMGRNGARVRCGFRVEVGPWTGVG